MATVLSEQLSAGKLSFINESVDSASGKKYLGRLRGECAECDAPTRNGRVYSRKLWEKVIGSDTFKEYLDNKCLYGELNHPEDRLETDIKEVAIALSDIDITPQGPINATFDILDTPNGRLLKSLCEYGSKLGVSSRGGGDVITRDGVQYVDEDSYDFVAFDVVVLPAVKKARPSVVESVEYKNKVKPLQESIKTEINNMTTKAELESVKRILENLDLPNKDSIMESIGNKLATLAGGPDSATLLEDLNKSIEQTSTLEKEKAELQEKLSAGATREMALKEDVKKTKSAMRVVTERLERAEARANIAETQSKELNEKVQALTKSNEVSEMRLSRITERLKEAQANTKLTEEVERVNNELVLSKDKTMMLESALSSEKEKSNKLAKSNEVLESYKKDSLMKMNSLNRKLTEALETKSKLEIVNKQLRDAYLESMCRQKGLDVKVVKESAQTLTTVSDIDKLLEQMSDYKFRFGSLPIELGSKVSVKANVVAESAPTRKSLNPDDDNLEGAAKLLNSLK